MNHKEQSAARERIATALFAAIVGAQEDFAAGKNGQLLAEIACDYADSLLRELERREERQRATSN